MRLTFVQLRIFTSDWNHLVLKDEDLRVLETAILNRPESGRVVPGTGGLRKLRFAPPSWGRGKSGATRVCYAFFPEAAAVYLFTIYTEQEADDLSAGDKVYFRTMLQDYRRWLKAHGGMLP